MGEYIFYIGGFALPDKGASAQRVISNAKALKQIGYQPVVVGFEDDISRSFEFDGIKCISYKYPKGQKNWLNYLLKIDYIKSLIDTYEKKGLIINSVIAYNYPSFALNKLNKYLHHKNIKCFGDCTEWYDTSRFSGVKKVIKKFDTEYRMRIVQKRLDGLIVISSFLQNYYRNQKTVLIPPLVDLSKFPKNVKKYEKFTICYCGSPGSKERLDLLINPIIENKYKINVIIAGISESEYRALYEVKYKIPENIKFLGRVSHEKALEIVAKSHYSFFFRKKNRTNSAGFSTKFVESISLGTSVITNDTGDLTYWIKKLTCGIILNLEDKKVINNCLINILKKKVYTIENIDSFDYLNYRDSFNTLLK